MSQNNYKYRNLSLGYIGEIHNEATLNAQYYAELWEKVNTGSALLSNFIIFPQRIPRTDFFNELYTLESKKFKNGFDKTTNLIKNNYFHYLQQINKKYTEVNIRNFINWANILLRYGASDFIINHFPNVYSGPYELEVKIIKETCKVESQLSKGETIDIHGFLYIANYYLSSKEISNREKIILLNRIIVYFYRHLKHSTSNKIFIEYSSLLMQLIENIDKTKFSNKIYCSVAYRGLAMVSDYEPGMQNSLLMKAERIANDLLGDTNLEKIAAAENLYNCIQSLCKWNLINNDFNQAEKDLQRLICIDPFDSTGHSEIGFFYIKTEQYELAAEYFKKAMELGPPSPSMNAYYFAKCLEKMGQESKAIWFLYESTELDKQAISPWLDLFEYFLTKGRLDKSTKIAKHIYDTPILKEQLEEGELIHIQANII